MILRADSRYYNTDVIAAARRHGARFSITARQNPAVRRAIAAIPEHAWTTIHYPGAVFDEQTAAVDLRRRGRRDRRSPHSPAAAEARARHRAG